MPLDRVTGQEVPNYSDPSPVSNYMTANTHANFAALLTNLQELINSLASHPACQKAHAAAPPNQPPPKDQQNKVYFMHDFCCRSRHMLLQIDPELKTKKAKEDFKDVYERCLFSEILVNDTSGKLSTLTEEKPGEEIDFGPEVKAAADRIGNVPDGDAIVKI